MLAPCPARNENARAEPNGSSGGVRPGRAGGRDLAIARVRTRREGRPHARAGACLLLGLLALASSPTRADEPGLPGADGVLVDPPLPAAVRDDRRLSELWRAPSSGALPDVAPLWDHRDPELQRRLDAIVEELGLLRPARQRRLAIAFVDLSNPARPRVAETNGDVMMYAASLPKIAVLLAVFDRAAAGQLEIDAETRELMRNMIRRSSNQATTELMHRVGKPNIAYTLLAPRYRLYDPARGGGLWVGKDYARSGLWTRDPLHNLSHGATAMQVARFYYMLEKGALVSERSSRRMKEILSVTTNPRKFAAGLAVANPTARFYRKSGTWRAYHSDSGIVQRDGRGYIAVGLTEDRAGKDWLALIVQRLDALVFPSDG